MLLTTRFLQYHPIGRPRLRIRYCAVSLGKDTGRGHQQSHFGLLIRVSLWPWPGDQGDSEENPKALHDSCHITMSSRIALFGCRFPSSSATAYLAAPTYKRRKDPGIAEAVGVCNLFPPPFPRSFTSKDIASTISPREATQAALNLLKMTIGQDI